jgi:hypothetical protein
MNGDPKHNAVSPAEQLKARLNPAQDLDAELFRVGYRWWLERYLADLKALWILDENALDDPDQIRRATLVLDRINQWSTHDLGEFMRALRKTTASVVADSLREAKLAQLHLTDALTGCARKKGSAA